MEFNISGTDWLSWFYPMGTQLGTLYQGTQHYPPFIYVWLWPLTLLGPTGGYVGLVLLSLLVIYLNVKSVPKLLLAVLSLPILIAISHGNVDALLSLVFLLPTSLGALIVACKPQALVVWWTRKWMYEGWKVHSLLPLGIVVIASLLIWGMWPTRLGGEMLATKLLVSGWWPWTLLVGIPLLLTNSPLAWLVGGILVVPYLQFYHLTPLVVYAVKRKGLGVGMGIMVISWVVGVALYG